MPKRVCCLYRVSTKKQVEKDDIPMQKQSCHEFCARQGWDVAYEFAEKGVSGFKVSAKNRDAILDIQTLAADGKIDVLLLFMFDRLGRIEEETPFVLRAFVEQGIEVWSVMEGQQRFDEDVDGLINFLRFWQASGESKKTSKRTKTRLAQIVQEGRFRGGIVPYGYRLEKQGRLNRKGDEVYELVVDEAEAATVGRIFELSAQYGCGGRKIATMLAEAGIHNRKGELFHYSTIQNILKNIAYTGIIRSGESFSEPFAHLQIISPELFELVQNQLNTRRANYDESRLTPMRREGDNLLSGNIFCGSCGGRLFGSTARRTHHAIQPGANVRIPIYKCYNRTQHKSLCAGQCVYKAGKIDEPVNAAICSVLERVKQTDMTEYRKERQRREQADIKSQMRQLESEYRRSLEEQQKLSGFIVQALEGNGPFTAEDLKSRMDTLKGNCTQLSARLEAQKRLLTDSESRNKAAARQMEQLRGYAAVFESAIPADRRMIASALVARVSVHPGYRLETQFRIGLDCLEKIPEAGNDRKNA